MPRPPHPALEKVLTAWFNGAELAAAWSAAGRPVSWSQMRRVANQNLEEHEKRQRHRARKRRRDDEESGDDDAADVAAPPPPAASASSLKRKQPPLTQEKAPAAAVPGGSARTGQIKPAVLRRTSLQVSKQLDVDRAYRMEYETAHKAAQAEYLAAREAGIHRKPPNRVSEIAARHDSTLSEGNPQRITASGLQNFKKRKGGQIVAGKERLVPKRGGRKGRGSLRGGKGLGGSQLLPELTGVSPGTAVANMSAEQRAALRAALEAAEEEEEES